MTRLVEPPDPTTTLATPTVIDVVDRAQILSRVRPPDRGMMAESMRRTASNRTQGVTDEKRRRHCGHAALLVACCVDADPTGSAAWLADLRAATSRLSAYQRELRASLDGGGVHRGTKAAYR